MECFTEHVVIENRHGDPVGVHRVRISDSAGKAQADQDQRSLYWFGQRELKRLSAALKGSTNWLMDCRIPRFCEVKVPASYEAEEAIFPMHKDVPVHFHKNLEEFYKSVGYDKKNKRYTLETIESSAPSP
ncbi:hypothetical protein IFT48_00515 [Pseudomonas fluorescens]|uniref:hypothetical protein n=1 Tax=Pseudomonas TaxID=286 RepID=UPI000F01C10A|nr:MULTISPECIES: hypothetical protein [Pseudomonas]MBD8088473.1 hypothetical protein [Pseudomonas fluorescens]MBD8615080.1 hypothetical protein [Pseudomonas putida]MBD8681244.1 hypothetical protein [Pseudomonas sp. CFBP 13719]